MSAIRYLNRYSGRVEEEAVYGEKYLRWIYETRLGRFALWALLKRYVFSAWYGRRMDRVRSRSKIKPFIENYGLDVSEFAAPVDSYNSFNEFFYRNLELDARPLPQEESAIVFPADGRHLGIERIGHEDFVYAKGQKLSLAELMQDDALASDFAGGSAIISRLCPIDYHRFHAPVSGKITQQALIKGSLFSVNPISLSRKLEYLWQNKRALTLIDSPKFGKIAFIAVGATCVGSIRMTAMEGSQIDRGDELGYFCFGGSCVITLFEKSKVALAEDLLKAASEGLELYAKARDTAGSGN